VPLLIIPVLVVLALIALIPISLVQRYRVGTSRQRARGWLATLNIVALSISAVLFAAGAAFTNIWVSDALAYTAAGLGVGGLLGFIGLRIARWEPSAGGLHYTPNRWLVLAMTLAVTGRVIYGFWRGWHSWRAGVQGGSWVVTAGVTGSMAAGAVVLGYYLVFWLGVRRRYRRHERRASRRM